MSADLRIILINMLGILLVIFDSCNPKDKVITKEMADKGKLLFNTVGCTKCHSMTGENLYGPPLIFTIGQEITVIRNGSMKNAEIDRKYIIRSMKDPDYEKLIGYQQKKMTNIDLSPDAIESLADYLIFFNRKQK